MDSDFWTSRIAAAKRQYALQYHHHPSSHLDRLGIDDFEVEEEVRPDFPCPYCYEDFDIASLCLHLEDEHSGESRVTADEWLSEICMICPIVYVENQSVNAANPDIMSVKAISGGKWSRLQICPICSVKVARDMLGHITLQHGHLFKLQGRRRLRRVAIPNSQTLSLLGRDLREAHLQVLLGGGSGGNRSNNAAVSNAATDPFLSSLILNFPACEAEEISKSVVTSSEDSSAKNTAPVHIWKSSFDPSLSDEEREKRMRQAAGRSGFVQDLFLSTLLND